MSSKALALGGVVVVLSGLAAWVGAHLALPAAVPQELPAAGGADVRSQLEEIERRLGYVEQRLEATERAAFEARDLAQALRDRPAGGASAPGPANPPDVGGPAPANGSGAAKGPAAAAPEPTDEERHAARVKNIQDTLRREARTMVPAILRQMADTDPRAAEARARDARIAARQMSVALAVTGEEADRLVALYVEQAERTAREIGPLVKDGLEKADVAAVEAGFQAAWDDMDRQAREILGDQKVARFTENAGSMRQLIREVLADHRKR
jgi:hypothetical protein